MKMALADKKAVPFRIPPGIKLVRVSLRTGLRAQGGEPDAVLEAFKPNEEPDDAYSDHRLHQRARRLLHRRARATRRAA